MSDISSRMQNALRLLSLCTAVGPRELGKGARIGLNSREAAPKGQ